MHRFFDSIFCKNGQALKMFRPKILVHLGASEVPLQFHEESLKYVQLAVETGSKLAYSGAKAEDVVAATIKVLEDCPVSDAGFGSVFNAEGKHQMDAGIMTGDKRYGAIASIHNVQNPIYVARKMLDDPKFSILCAEGAMDFVRKNNFELVPDSKFVTPYNEYIRNQYGAHGDPLDLFVRPEDEHGTVGCVVMDIYGNIAAGTSTGGTPFAPKGRIGDSPFPGCGVWADDEDGAVSCTGYGEEILVNLLAAKAASLLEKNSSMESAQKAIEKFAQRPRSVGGLIIISKKTGDYGYFHNTKHMPVAMLMDDGSIKSGMTFDSIQ